MKKVAIVYDYDGTLAQGNIQEHSFLPSVEIDKNDFWGEVKALSTQHDADNILVYMWQILKKASEKNISVTREALKNHGAATELFDGVTSWFARINDYSKSHDIDIEHYVVSSGTGEMIEGAPIYKEFKKVFASRFIFDTKGAAVWPAVAINYTNKTQFLFRINKGIDNSSDNETINKYIPEKDRPIPFSRMIFIGDGDTDIPAMKMVRHQGGHSIAVFDPSKWNEQDTKNKVYKLIAEDRAHFVVPADYSEGSQLNVTVKGILSRMAVHEK